MDWSGALSHKPECSFADVTGSVLSSKVSELVFPHLSKRDKHLWEEMIAAVGLYSSHICRSPRGLEGIRERLASGRICLATARNNSQGGS